VVRVKATTYQGSVRKKKKVGSTIPNKNRLGGGNANRREKGETGKSHQIQGLREKELVGGGRFTKIWRAWSIYKTKTRTQTKVKTPSRYSGGKLKVEDITVAIAKSQSWGKGKELDGVFKCVLVGQKKQSRVKEGHGPPH